MVLQSQRLQGGFSLIELLVALMVVVLLTAVVSLGVGRGGADIALDDDVAYFAKVFELISVEAELAGADYGLYFEEIIVDGKQAIAVSVLQSFDQGWAAPRVSREQFRDLAFDPQYDIAIRLDGQPELLLEPVEGRDESAIQALIPQVQFYAGGEVTPGEIDWVDPQTGAIHYRLSWDLFGRTAVLIGGERRIDDD